MRQYRQKVAVIGAGIAGLSCASLLAGMGHGVVVFEKSRGTGGRTSTRKAEPDISFDHGAQYFTVRTPVLEKTVSSWIESGIVAEWKGRIIKIANDQFEPVGPLVRYVGVPGMTAMAQHLAKDLEIEKGTKITGVDRSSSQWVLADENGNRHGFFDQLIVALPSPQAAELLADHPLGKIPASVPMSPCWAVLAGFSKRIDYHWDGAFIHDSPLSWAARNSSKPGRNSSMDCWVLHANAHWSQSHLEEGPEQVIPKLLNAFSQAIGEPLPDRFYEAAHRWRYSIGGENLKPKDLFHEPTGLTLCGDWANGGRFEGAYLSGISAAENLLQHIPPA